MRGCVGFFGIVAPPWFGCPFLVHEVQSTGLGCMGLDQSATCSALVLQDLDQKFLVLTWATPGLFLGVLAPLDLADQDALALGLWFGVDWWFLGVATGVVVMTEGAQ